MKSCNNPKDKPYPKDPTITHWVPCTQNKYLIIVKRWLPSILLCIFIYCLSSLQGASVVGLLPDTKASYQTDIVVHKTIHFFIYMTLCLSFYRATKNIPLAIILASLYGITDEFHQTFVPTRSGKVFDIVVDSAGATLGGVLLWRYFPRLPQKLINWLQE